VLVDRLPQVKPLHFEWMAFIPPTVLPLAMAMVFFVVFGIYRCCSVGVPSTLMRVQFQI
jgi:hypothetical protein